MRDLPPSQTLWRPGLLLAALTLALLLAPVASRADNDEAIQECLECHAEPDMTMELGDGTSLRLTVEKEALAGSVHGDQLVCTDCHEGYDQDHPEDRKFANRREYVLASYEMCRKCHFDTYTRTLESVHYKLLQRGVAGVPVCTDCHGAHDVHDPHERRAMMSRSCASCHTEVYRQYAQSVHGRALVETDNRDVPACSDCHTHHSIEPPETVRFRLASPGICIGCHGDEKRMSRYDIPADVASTYLADFHGVTASLSSNAVERKLVVTCIDCHGVHDIASPARIGSDQVKAQVASVCSSCHPGAASDFPAAWLSHFRPSLQHAPLVYLVDLFYRIFIPFVIFGLILQVLLHMYRFAVRR